MLKGDRGLWSHSLSFVATLSCVLNGHQTPCRDRRLLLPGCFSGAFQGGQPNIFLQLLEISGGRTGTRTPDPLIKSQLLYQLSYAPPRVTVAL